MDYRRRRRHNDSSGDRRSKKAKYSDELPKMKPEDYRVELQRFLSEQANIRRPDDFWRFYGKYQSLRKPSSERGKLLNVYFDDNYKILYDRLPVLDRNGEKFRLSFEDFQEFLTVVRVYVDFEQKCKFSKVKALRNAQKLLPIAGFREEIIEKLTKSRVVLIAGDTGCGKSTQVPQYIYQAGYRKIVCTQPRRIACVALAKRVAHEMLADYKSTVGYQIRFEKNKRADTAVIFMTEGLLLRQAAEEETLNSYDVFILDEVHERHLTGDFLVGIMKCMLRKRRDFKLVLMSATINLQVFAEYFQDEGVEIVQVPGRLYPIQMQYKPVVIDPYARKSDRFNPTPYLQIIQMIDEKYQADQKGDLLIFLNGFSEISALASAVETYAEETNTHWLVLQLHSSLSLEEQDKVFDFPPEGVRKCVISTNIAETSVTIDGIRFVIDSGKVNRMVYNRLGVNKLSEVTISQDSAKQRAGRAGRTGPGFCYRLYSQEDFQGFDAYTPAEIHLVPLDTLLLQMVSLGLSDVAQFPFLERPAGQSLEEAVEKLKFIGALALKSCGLELTALGSALGQLPVDLAIGKMLVLSTVFDNVNSVLALAALMSVQSPLTQAAYRDVRAAELRRPLESSHGDPITLLSFYKEWLTVKLDTTPNSTTPTETSKHWSKKRCLEEQRFYETTKLSTQFRDILQDAQLLPKLDEEQLTSGQRAMKHGERKHLRQLRYKLKNRPKEKSGEELSDLRDVEFRLSNNLERLLAESSANSHRDLFLLKLILTSGLYPQIAVEDEFNSSKTVADRLYHTKNKSFVFLRPLSYFANHPEVLELHVDDVEVPPVGYFSKHPISQKHQLLVYQTILETKRVYLVNTMRMPVLPTLLLFAKTIGTNASITRLVFDDFLLLDVPYFPAGKTMLIRAVKLRKRWEKSLEDKLATKDVAKLDDGLVEDLLEFLGAPVSYNIKRLLPADLPHLYLRDQPQPSLKPEINPFDPDFPLVANAKLGGVNVTENVVYDCLVQEEWSVVIDQQICNTPFVCPKCSCKKLGLGLFEIMQHESRCKDEVVEVKVESSGGKRTSNSRLFSCEKCGEDLWLTPVETLRHKKVCGRDGG